MSSKKQHLVIATDSFIPRWDGVARFLVEMIPHLSETFNITVIAPNFGKVRKKGYKLIQIPLRKGHYGDLRLAQLKYFDIKKIIKTADIVFTQTIGPIGAAAIFAAKNAKIPLVSFIHSLESELVPMAVKPTPMRTTIYSFMRWYTTFLYSKPDLLITPSEHVDDQLSWQGIRTKKKVIRLGVDVKKFSPGSAKTLRKQLGITEDDIVVGQHGRLAREKDIKTLMRAFFRTQKKYPQLKLLIVAHGIPEIKQMLKGRDGIILTGAQDDVIPYLRAMDLYVLSSLTETTSLATLEAMAVGIPVICTPVGFVKDYINDGKNGLFFPFKDPYKLSKQIEWAITHPTLAKRMGEQGRELVVKQFTWEQTIISINEALHELLNQDR